MLSSEWSLVMFTILVQAAVGMVLVSEAARLCFGVKAASLRWQTPVACAMSLVAVLLSLTHLGTPSHSIFTVLNIGHSWLSREIASVGCFSGLLLVLSVLRRNNASIAPLALVTVCMGLVTVGIMSKVYLLETIPVWNTVSTVLGFFSTVLLTGAVVSGMVYSLEKDAGGMGDANSGRLMGVGSLAATAGLALKFVSIPLSMLTLGVVGSTGASGMDMLAGTGVGILVICILLVFFGGALFAWSACRTVFAGHDRPLIGSTLCALALVLAGEVLSRLMFYGSYLRIGL
ncbi:dimethyl sulfoxide reductase anchor subunit [Desulfovibrio sp. UIB00]|uniref:dimethyl sulfoxide reductase anchor subunit family protein n=1 Tax=Desulfovibrio sp. UIB00 TaxID=2804314 RepID=UPI001F105A81|nr:DmsC/YnfH family molybdoenzyme membrane anchor subunit [Desulfovibrio sp. UIB00]MCH5143721.1 dimethyl sulfoxide reductase anchor subunit [Desulfovibrio sp. UIB00]